MKNFASSLLFQVLCIVGKLLAKPTVLKFLRRWTRSRFYYATKGYMLRYFVVPELSWFPYVIQLHLILRKDLDDLPHDHPWEFCSIIISGWYLEIKTEDNVVLKVNKYGPGSVHTFGKGDYHKIIDVAEEGCWTLCIRKKSNHDWGFLRGAGEEAVHIDRKIYLGRNYDKHDQIANHQAGTGVAKG